MAKPKSSGSTNSTKVNFGSRKKAKQEKNVISMIERKRTIEDKEDVDKPFN